MATHYGETIGSGIFAGQTASIGVREQVVDTIILEAGNKGFTAQETAALLAVANTVKHSKHRRIWQAD